MAKTLQIDLKERDPVRVECDDYKTESDFLVLTRGGGEIGRYNLTQIIGYREVAPKPNAASLSSEEFEKDD